MQIDAQLTKTHKYIKLLAHVEHNSAAKEILIVKYTVYAYVGHNHCHRTLAH